MLDEDVAQLYVFDFVAGDSADDRAYGRSGIGADDVADQDSAQRADRNACGAAHAGA